ncbi:hypothetical protein [Caloranaerobacter ferrireducens]|nr:hypothetical protein [Caloranaerobacter ferrireducens]
MDYKGKTKENFDFWIRKNLSRLEAIKWLKYREKEIMVHSKYKF